MLNILSMSVQLYTYRWSGCAIRVMPHVPFMPPWCSTEWLGASPVFRRWPIPPWSRSRALAVLCRVQSPVCRARVFFDFFVGWFCSTHEKARKRATAKPNQTTKTQGPRGGVYFLVAQNCNPEEKRAFDKTPGVSAHAACTLDVNESVFDCFDDINNASP